MSSKNELNVLTITVNNLPPNFERLKRLSVFL